MALTEIVLRCKVLAISPEGLVTLEVQAYNNPVVICVAGLGQGFNWSANLVEPEIKDFSGAALALEKVRRA
jgi:hypothetical protein